MAEAAPERPGRSNTVLPYIPTPQEGLRAGPHLVWSSLEDAGTLVDGLCPQTDVFVLQLLGCAVHGLGDQAAFRNLTLQLQTSLRVSV